MSGDDDGKAADSHVEVDDDLIEEIVSRVASRMRPAGGSRPAAADRTGGDLDGQIRRAVDEATSRERERTASQKHADDVNARLKAVEERTEKAPVELRGVTKFFWGNE